MDYLTDLADTGPMTAQVTFLVGKSMTLLQKRCKMTEKFKTITNRCKMSTQGYKVATNTKK